jgi:low temperature requirement protein LtrA
MVLGIVLAALGLETTIGHVDDRLERVPAFALVGGVALYLLGHVAFRLRTVRSLSPQRLLVALVILALFPVASQVPALVTLGLVTVAVCALIAYEAFRFAATRDRVRHQPADQASPE